MIYQEKLRKVWQKINLKKIIIFSSIIRIILLPWTYHGDVTVTYWWGKFAEEFTWRGYYNWLNFGGYGRPDQPMINIIYDWLIRLLYNFFYKILWFFNLNIPIFPSKFMSWYFFNGNQILLKLPMIIADVFIIYFIYRFIAKNFSTTKAKIIAIILALYPPLIYNSAVWGSGDSLVNLFGLISVFFLYQKKYLKFVFFIILCVLYKTSLIIWAPIILVILVHQKIKLKELFKMTFISGLLIYFISLPFSIKNPLIWFYETMTQKILPGAMAQITVNAMNFWAIIYGLLPQRLDESLVFNLISHRQLSLLICVILYLIICFKLYKKYTIQNLLLSLVNISLVTFMFMTRMHERYTFPALLPLLILCFYDKKLIKYFVILSITHLLNVYNWWWIPNIKPLIFILKQDIFIRLISIINLIITFNLFNFSLKEKSNDNKKS